MQETSAKKDSRIPVRVALWLSFGAMEGFLIILVSPLGRLLGIPGDLSTYVLPIGLLGLLVVALSVVSRTGRWLRTFLITAGASAMGWPIGLFLHSTLYRYFPQEPATYLLVFYILPVTFLLGTAGAVGIGIKRLITSRKR